MSLMPTQIQATQVQEDDDAASSSSEGSPTNLNVSLTQSAIATQIQDDDHDDEDDEVEASADQEDTMDTTEQGNQDEPVAFDEEEEEEKPKEKKSKKKKKKQEKQRRQKKDNDADYKEDEEEEELDEEEVENKSDASEDETKTKKRKRLQKGGKKDRKKKKESPEPANTESTIADDENVAEDEEDEQPSSSSRSRSNRQVDEDDEFERVVVKELKSQRSSRGSQKEKEAAVALAEEQAEKLVAELKTALENDVMAVKTKKPAIYRLQKLKDLTEASKKIYLQGSLIGKGILQALEMWLDPQNNSATPNINIQTAVLNVLNDLPVATTEDEENECITVDHLKESKIAKLVKQISTNPTTPPNNKKLAAKIVERWSRLVYKLPSEYKYSANQFDTAEPRKKSSKTSSVDAPIATRGSTDTGSTISSRKKDRRNKNPSLRASIPKKDGFDFVRLPPSKVTKKKEQADNETHKRLLSVGKDGRRR